ncbi:beta-mannosidase-like isoform X1 [Zophobas morio]|uniref:beta-mannosidase-like isoform X1 n=1 Tax=Zophobas morio TaxID=2755281 RepID=UPI00308372AD
MAGWRKLVFFATNILGLSCLQLQDLGGQWSLTEATGKYNNLNATVPGGIYTDLMQNKIIGDIFYGNNDTETRWVAETNWTYKYQFAVDDSILNHSTVNIVFEGLDTFATILVNDVEIGTSQNMFVRYIFDVKDVLKLGNNNIEVRFASPIITAKELSSKQGYDVPPVCPQDVQNGECHVNQIRKMQASFSWDWGPAFPSMGIWKEVYLEAFDSSVIRYLLVDYDETSDDSWMITISAYLSATKGKTLEGKLRYTLETDVSSIEQIVEVNEPSNDNDEIKIDYSFTVPKITVRNWWPNGYGEAKLYALSAQFQSGSEVSSKNIKIGFRKIEIVQEPIASGLSFYFKVNDVPIFAKGANEIPIDILPEKGQNPETIAKILESAHAANMNMLRVWGGGVYESDYFYQKTDELGILVWQDFMFACAMYPTYPEFLNNVRVEIRHQIKRLHSHPSIALWAGNNENEIALMTDWYNTKKNLTLFKNDYLKLYIGTVRSELLNITNNVLFLSSSPSNGEESEEEHYLAKNPGDPLFGDVHFYNYLVNSLVSTTYPIPRFASEYGYQSLPDADTWLTVTDDVDNLDPGSVFMYHRQHHVLGFAENSLLIGYQLNLNKSIPDYYKTYIFYSQIVQALSIKFETEYYRSFMGRVDSEGRGNTMGALFWQLNDVWVAPTWSGIDYTGKWKMLQYYAIEFFAPTIITGYLDVSRQFAIYAMSEIVSLVGVSLDVSAVVEVYSWSSFERVGFSEYNVTLEYGKSVEVNVIDTDSYLQSLGCGSLSEARTNCFFYLTLLSGNAVIAPHNLIMATSLKQSNLTKTTVEIVSIRQVDTQAKKFEISIQADGVSLFVWLDSHQIRGRFSENGFAQIGPTKNVSFQAEEATSVAELETVLTIVHLNNAEYQ